MAVTKILRGFSGLRAGITATLMIVCLAMASNSLADGDYEDLLQLFEDWRKFERPPSKDGAPDYSAKRFAAAHKELQKYQARLNELDISGWPIEQQVDWHVVRAEMNGFDFNHRVLKPWVRDPAYYQSVWMSRSDAGHSGRSNHALLEFWTYSLPLSADERQRLISDLRVIPPLLAQARTNLTGNARDLWIAGIKNIRDQVGELAQIHEAVDAANDPELAAALGAASDASSSLVSWLEQQAPAKTGPSGVGKKLRQYQQNVHYVPRLGRRGDAPQARTRSLGVVGTRRTPQPHIPPLVAVTSPQEYDERADQAASRFMAFLEKQEILTVKDYMEPALREHLGSFVPLEQRNFFAIAMHYDPTTLYTHFYHWFELARMDLEPHASPVRRGPVLYNIFDSRNEGTATGVEKCSCMPAWPMTIRTCAIVWIAGATRNSWSRIAARARHMKPWRSRRIPRK
jgi:hypothetical protein